MECAVLCWPERRSFFSNVSLINVKCKTIIDDLQEEGVDLGSREINLCIYETAGVAVGGVGALERMYQWKCTYRTVPLPSQYTYCKVDSTLV